MSVIDRVESAKHTIVGSPIGRAVAKATSREIIGPKRKHVDCKFCFFALGHRGLHLQGISQVAT